MVDYLSWFLLFLLCALLGQVGSLQRKLQRIQWQLDSIQSHLNVQPSASVPPEVVGLLQAGRKIEAIKVYRQATGAGLADAKAAVERIEASGPSSQPNIIQM